MRKAPKDTLRVFATVGFPALQFNDVKKQFVATRNCPIRTFGFQI